jgi:PAS domain S-box-containing protein
MIKAGNVMPAAGRLDLSSTGAERTARSAAWSFSLGLTVMAIIALSTVALGAWVLIKSSQIIHRLEHSGPTGASLSDIEFLHRLTQWELAALLAVIGGGVILVTMTFRAVKARNASASQAEHSGSREQELRDELATMRGRFATLARDSEDARRAQEALNARIADLTQANAKLTDDLDRRRRAEKDLSLQREQLARSKNLLEVHVTARTQELEKLQRQSQLILNSVGEGICGLDLNGKVTFANPAAARILGRSVQDIVGRPGDELFTAFKTDGEIDKSKGKNQPHETVAMREDGSSFSAEFLRSPLEESGRTVGEVLAFKDITERKKAEQDLAEKAAELARSNAELEQFAFVASHDLQEPLRKIQAFGDRLKMKCDEAKLADGRDYLERMQNAAARMRTLIDDLLTFSRVISRTEPFSSVNLTTVTKEVLSDLEVRLEKSGARVEVGELPTVDADAVQMRQLLQNLIGNALKFQPPGGKPVVQIDGGLVTPGLADGHTIFFKNQQAEDIDPTARGQYCEFRVRDNGIGFDEKYTEKIFAVFQRLHGRQEYEGTGIGLAVCRRIVERHGGTISARSKPGEGATFSVLLPVRQNSSTT